MDQENIPYIEEIKNHLRNVTKQERQMKRDNLVNRRRGVLGEFEVIHETSYTSDEVLKTTNSIKKKGKITEDSLRFLRGAFIQKEDNINAFLSVERALHAVVGELCGTNSVMQLLAAECLVNLSLGNEKCCYKIAKMSGAYLIMHLEGMNLNLKNISIWALANLLGSDGKTWELLKSQGVLSHLLNLLNVPELSENVVYGLSYYARTGIITDLIESDELQQITNGISNLSNSPPNILWLICILSSSEGFSESVLFSTPELWQNIIFSFEEFDSVYVIYAIRILANVLCESCGRTATMMLADETKTTLFFKTCEKIFSNRKYQIFSEELCWLIGNILNHSSLCVQEQVLHHRESFKHLESLLKTEMS